MTDKHVQTSLAFVQEVLKDYHPRDFAVRLWDGTTWAAEAGQPTRFTLVLKHPGALRRMFLPPTELRMGEAYIYEDFDIEGDIDAVFKLGDSIMNQKRGLLATLRNGLRLMNLPKARPAEKIGLSALSGQEHSKERDKAAVTYHYNVSNDFYALWLDKNMVYSCAYFATPDQDLDAAQENKLDYLCRKLRLQRGEKLLDIGCGWGGLMIHAAKHYGAYVRGITLSQPQADYANARIRAEGLEDRCCAEVRDYRDLDEPEGYDKLVSVGMFEHVGAKLLPTYFKKAWELLKPGGVFLNHGISIEGKRMPSRRESFTLQYVFPDGELVRISETLRAAEDAGFEVRDVESLREHYALTLTHWTRRLEANCEKAIALVGKVTYRIWYVHHAGAAYGFETRGNNLYQTLLVKSGKAPSGLPLTREDWYA